MFVIEDDLHAEPIGTFLTRKEAVEELQRLRATVWDRAPNRAPCMSWQTCGRRYVLVEFDDRFNPWRAVASIPALDISAEGVIWKL